MSILHAVSKLVEAMRRPGLMGAIGKRREKACQRDVAAYFRLLLDKTPIEALSKLALAENKDIALHEVTHRMTRALRVARPHLISALSINMLLAYKEGWEHAQVHDVVKEADSSEQPLVPSGAPLDFVGPTGLRAADFAATSAGELVKGLDETTLEIIQDLVSEGIEERWGVDGLARRLRDEIRGMSLDRAKVIATTEMNKAMSKATLEKLDAMNVEYKLWIPVDDPCPICEDNAAQGAIPIDDEFDSGDDTPPAHPNCRCAVVGARPPKGA